MAVAFDSTFQLGALAASPRTVSGTVGSASNRVLIGFVRIRLSVAGTGTIAMTWNAVSMTPIGSLNEPNSIDSVHVFGLKNPASGTFTLSFTHTGGGSHDTTVGAIAVSGADQTTGWQNYTTNTGTTTGPTLTITSANGNFIAAIKSDNNGAAPHNVTAGTLAWSELDLNGNDGGAYRPSTGASNTITWSMGGSADWAMAGVDIIAAAAGGTVIQEATAAYRRRRIR